jgi:hypothetical protein
MTNEFLELLSHRLLAPKILHLNQNQLFWECLSMKACERYPDGMPEYNDPFAAYMVTRDTLRQELCTFNDNVLEDDAKTRPTSCLWKLWPRLISIYTDCAPTFPDKDRLIAPSGVASVLQKSFGGRYLACLWEKNLPEHMLWALNTNWEPRPYPIVDRAPSWSWTSTNGSIIVPFENVRTRNEVFVNILNCEITHTSRSRHADISKGSIRLSGWLATIEIAHLDGKQRAFLNGSWGTFFLLRLDSELPANGLHILPITAPRTQANLGTMSCLLLAPTGEARGQFRRFGVLYLLAANVEGDWARFRQFHNEEWLGYEANDGSGNYMISIV